MPNPKTLCCLMLACLALQSEPVRSDSEHAVPNVLATIKPLHSLVAGLMGDVTAPQIIVGTQDSPHDYQLVPSIVSDLHESGVVIYIDNRFEVFLSSRAFRNLPEHVLRVPVAVESGIKLWPLRTGGDWGTHFHDHDHDHEDHEGHGEHNDDLHDSRFEGNPPDLHVWLDPRNAKKIVLYLERVLGKVHPDSKETYSANAKALVKRLDELDRELELELESVREKPYVVFHDAYQYFERRYGLNAIGAIKLEPHEGASPNKIIEIRAKLVQSGAKCVFREPGFSDRVVSAVIERTSAKSAVLDPLGINLPADADLYFKLMRNLVRNLKDCLG